MSFSSDPTMENLKNRYKKLYDEKIRVETELKTVTSQLNQHKEMAKTNWGTDDIMELEKKLETIKEANETRRKDYEEHLNQIELQLNSIKGDPNESAI